MNMILISIYDEWKIPGVFYYSGYVRKQFIPNGSRKQVFSALYGENRMDV